VASLTVVERFADGAVSWLPMYGEAKLALVVYLWHPSTRVSIAADRPPHKKINVLKPPVQFSM
jgi:hypothetical protein